jgi:hypothetical protein
MPLHKREKAARESSPFTRSTGAHYLLMLSFFILSFDIILSLDILSFDMPVVLPFCIAPWAAGEPLLLASFIIGFVDGVCADCAAVGGAARDQKSFSHDIPPVAKHSMLRLMWINASA